MNEPLEPLRVYVSEVTAGPITDQLVAEARAALGEDWSHLEDPQGAHHFIKAWDGQPVERHPREDVEVLLDERDAERRHLRVTGPR
jgi:hypothetical protein